MIKISNLNKYYNKGKSNEIHVLNDISLELPNTSLITVFGKSGSGKSTLLNVIGGLDKATGTINYNDELIVEKYSPNKIDPYRNNNIGYIFQNYHLIPELSVYENLVYALELIGVTEEQEVSKRIDEALNLVGMKTYKKRNALALSGGQQQRVAIARALIKGAKILIADEPTGNLDSENTIEVMNILKSISKTKLVLLVTHNQEIANDYADRIINIKDGQIVDDQENKAKVEISDTNTEAFSDVEIYKYNFVQYFFKRLIISLKQFFTFNVRSTFINLCFILIGLIVTYNVSNLSSNMYINKDDMLKSQDYEIVYIKDKDIDKAELQKEEYKDLFIFPTTSIYLTPSISLPIAFNHTLNLASSGEMLNVNSIKHYSNISYSNELQDDEILLSKYTAELFVESISRYIPFTEKDLIGYTFFIDNFSYEIVGVEKDLENKVLISSVNTYLNFNNFDYMDITGLNNQFYTYEDAIELGVDLPAFTDYKDGRINAYVNGTYSSSFNTQTISTSLLPANAVVFATASDYISNFGLDIIYKDYSLTEGVDPVLSNEIILPSYFKNTSQEDVYEDYVITGYYDLEAGEYPCAISSLKTFLFKDQFYGVDTYSFYTTDMQEVLELFDNATYYKTFILDNQFEFNKKANIASIMTILGMLLAVVVILFFIARARMLSKIKTIGIYRSLGSSKLKIYISFIAESLVLVTFTTVFGLVLCNIGINNIISYVPLFASIRIPFMYNVITIILIYVVMVLSSLMPVLLLLRKTPIEITSKYDI